MGAIPPHRGGRDRPGLSADSYFAEALWPIPGRSQRGAAGNTIYHPHSTHEGYDTRSRGSAGGVGVCRERPRGFRPGGRRDHPDGGRRVRAFTQMRPRDSDSGSDETTPGRESWRSALGQELVVLSTPRPRGRGKRRPERREGAAKRPRVESSSSDQRNGAEAGVGPVQPQPCRRAGAGTTRVQPRARDRVIRE